MTDSTEVPGRPVPLTAFEQRFGHPPGLVLGEIEDRGLEEVRRDVGAVLAPGQDGGALGDVDLRDAAAEGAGELDNLGLPESGDGKSDLLQEAKWEADFLANLNDLLPTRSARGGETGSTMRTVRPRKSGLSAWW